MRLTDHQLLVFLVQFAVVLMTARVLGEIARRFRQPPIAGELLAGILLGPTLLGRLLPSSSAWLFPLEAPQPQMLEAVSWIGAMLILLVAGMEVDLGAVRRQAGRALGTAGVGLLGPAIAGGLLSIGIRDVGMGPMAAPGMFALVVATVIGISALPVIARTLLDLRLLRTDVGAVILAAATLDDLAGWLVFSVLLASTGATEATATGLAGTVVLTVAFSAFALTGGRWVADGWLAAVDRVAPRPDATLTAVLIAGFAAAAATQGIGIHAVFGAFLAGIALGQSARLRASTREVLEQLATGVFAPLFFASMARKADFITSFRPGLVAAVFAVAVISKVVGAWAGARVSGVGRRNAISVAVALNARGAMGVILASLALKAELITPELFVALVLMSIGTSLMAGPLLARLTSLDRLDLTGVVSDRSVRIVAGRDLRVAVRALADAAVREHALLLESSDLIAALVDAEPPMAFAIERDVAIVQLQLESLDAPFLAVAVCPDGVVIGERSCRLLLLVASPREDEGAATALVALVRTRLGAAEAVESVLAARTPAAIHGAVVAVLRGREVSAGDAGLRRSAGQG